MSNEQNEQGGHMAAPGDDNYRRPAWDRLLEQDVTAALVMRAAMNGNEAEALEAVLIGALQPLSGLRLKDVDIAASIAAMVLGYELTSGNPTATLLYSIITGVIDGLIEADRIRADRKAVQS